MSGNQCHSTMGTLENPGVCTVPQEVPEMVSLLLSESLAMPKKHLKYTKFGAQLVGNPPDFAVVRRRSPRRRACRCRGRWRC